MPLLKVENLVQEFPTHGVLGQRKLVVHAVSDVSFELDSGEALGLVGETGSGKSSLALALLQIARPKSGSVYFRGHDLTKLRGRRLREQRRHMQMVFQDPSGSLNPRWRVADVIEEPLIGLGIGSRAERRRRVERILDVVGLPFATFGRCRPKELSGGQCQRVAIARALAPEPALLICDEATSSLDAVVQAQLVGLLARLRTELRLSLLFISHDLPVVRQLSDRVAVLHSGQLAEVAPTQSLCRSAFHPYAARLVAAARSYATRGPVRSQAGLGDDGDPPSPINPPSGCRFRLRCTRAQEICSAKAPAMRQLERGHFVACHSPLRDESDDASPGRQDS